MFNVCSQTLDGGKAWELLIMCVFCSLHDEVVAQRALDRRLTSELKRFKSRITSLTRWDNTVYVGIE